MPISTTSTAAPIILLLLLTLTSGNLSLPFDKIYAFGASYTDTGNTNSTTGPSIFRYVSNPPYGRTFFHHPTNRYSDGRLVIDFIAESLNLPFLRPYLNIPNSNTSDKSINYAVAGSTAIPYEFFVMNNLILDITPVSLQTQLTWFEETLEGYKCKSAISTPVECADVFRDTLVWVGEIGVNDYAYSLGSTVSGETILQLAIQSVTEFLETLLYKGAKYVAVQGLPTTGCLSLSLYLSPASPRDHIGCVAASNIQSYIHNTILQANIHLLRRKYPKAVIVYVDYWNAYRYVIKNGPRLGFRELFNVCCGSSGEPYNVDLNAICGSQSSSSCDNPSQYVSWDGLHLTEAMHKVLTRLFLNGPFTHPSFKYLLRRKQHSK